MLVFSRMLFITLCKNFEDMHADHIHLALHVHTSLDDLDPCLRSQNSVSTIMNVLFSSFVCESTECLFFFFIVVMCVIDSIL